MAWLEQLRKGKSLSEAIRATVTERHGNWSWAVSSVASQYATLSNARGSTPDAPPEGEFPEIEAGGTPAPSVSCQPGRAEDEQSLDPAPVCPGRTSRRFSSVPLAPGLCLAMPARILYLVRECPFVRLLILVSAQRVASVRKATCMHAVLLTLADAFAVSLVTDVATMALSIGDGNSHPVPMHVIRCRAVCPRGH